MAGRREQETVETTATDGCEPVALPDSIECYHRLGQMNFPFIFKLNILIGRTGSDSNH